MVSIVWVCFSLEGTHRVALGKLPDDVCGHRNTPILRLITSKHIQTTVMGGGVEFGVQRYS